MPAGEKTKFLWQDPEYRKRMSDVHTGKKYPEQSKRMMGNKIAFKNRVVEILCPICKKNKFKKFISQNKKYCSTECSKKVLRELMILTFCFREGYILYLYISKFIVEV